ncbi:c-type cytochrome [Campylobacter sp. faydin G-140]|uniref:c-type cytochrome n=1 Tax=Campylobacter anatolicus TaxID=2829105 RepID=UPI001BA2EAD3|nr:c-type cytochrome [Campylobacter anatolicus]MBR8461745.1 c-type cytochrome [Campylobacter anatolicus]MBR8465167.1 c-type cytochrome [Campylobacter anatolicus]
MQWFNLEDNINLLSLIGAFAIIILTIYVAGRYVNQMKQAKDTSMELSEHVWDGIGEYKNNPPIGWIISFVLILVWAVWYYLIGYPLNSYSQIGEYNEEVKAMNAKFAQDHANLDNKTLQDMGSGIYIVQCSACHGITGDGINAKAADLRNWGSEQALYEVIVNGSKGMGYPAGEMPKGMDLGVDNDTAKAIAAYVAKEISGIKSTKNENLVENGKAMFAMCAACHGEDGKGANMAPDLTKYGTSEFVVDVLNHGKSGTIGIMPKFDNRLNEIQQKAVGEYIISLSRGK